jgi:hypothetical protein
MLKEWQKEQESIGRASRRFFGEGLSSEFRKIAEKLVEAAVKPATGVEGALIGGLTGHGAIGVGAGFAIAVVFRGLESWGKARREAKASPLRYLTKMLEQGVTFSVASQIQP